MKKYRGFTFIEMMVALTVFSIGVLAVMRVITQNLTSMDKAETTTVATFLAKEGIELAYNVRDSNLQKGLPRNCILDARPFGGEFDIDPDKACLNYFSSGAQGYALLLGFVPLGYFSIDMQALASGSQALFDQFRLYHFTKDIEGKTLSWYGYTGENGVATPFARYVLFTGVQAGSGILPLQNILKVESHVLAKKGSTQQDTVLESFIGKQ